MYQQATAPAEQQPAPSIAEPQPDATAANSESQPGDVHAEFDSNGHREVGDSVAGTSVDVNGVEFTPGELNAVVDYVGSIDELYGYDKSTLLQMKALLDAGSEDTAAWDRLTNGGYSKLAQANENHFAPGADGGGTDYRSSFIGLYSAGVAQMQQALGEQDVEGEERARASGYAAEHFLEDAFSAGHKVAAADVETSVDACLEQIDYATVIPAAAFLVYEGNAATIACYGTPAVGPVPAVPISTWEQFLALCVPYGWAEGRSSGYDAIRKFVHEKLCATGVEVSSPAHPAPWTLPGDAGLPDNPETVAALQAALNEARTNLELASVPSGGDPKKMAADLFDRHCPVPTGNGRAAIDQALAEATANPAALVQAMASAMGSEIGATMDVVVEKSRGAIVKLKDTPEKEEPEPGEIPDQHGPGLVGPTYGGMLPTLAQRAPAGL